MIDLISLSISMPLRAVGNDPILPSLRHLSIHQLDGETEWPPLPGVTHFSLTRLPTLSITIDPPFPSLTHLTVFSQLPPSRSLPSPRHYRYFGPSWTPPKTVTHLTLTCDRFDQVQVGRLPPTLKHLALWQYFDELDPTALSRLLGIQDVEPKPEQLEAVTLGYAGYEDEAQLRTELPDVAEVIDEIRQMGVQVNYE